MQELVNMHNLSAHSAIAERQEICSLGQLIWNILMNTMDANTAKAVKYKTACV